MSSAVPQPKINYAGNSKLDKEIAAEETATQDEPRLTKIEGLNVVKTKKSLGSRVRENFGGQPLKTVGMHLLIDVVIPSGKDLLMGLIEEGGRRAIYGDSPRRPTAASSVITTLVGNAARSRGTNYSTISTQSRGVVGSGGGALANRDLVTFDFTVYAFPDAVQANEVLARMDEAIQEYGQVNVAEFYELIGQSGNGFTDQKFGWDARAFAPSQVRKARDGWILDLPAPLEIR